MYDPYNHKAAIKNRYDFVIIIEVRYSNPNGTNEGDGEPRVDALSGLGIISDACVKRKIRNFVEARMSGVPGYAISTIRGLPQMHEKTLALKPFEAEEDGKKVSKKDDPYQDFKVRDFMSQNFWDIRAFGGVMPNSKNSFNCGQINGPVSIYVGTSVEPITTQLLTMTRSTVANEKEAETKQTTFGHKYIVPYALYRVTGSVSANFAQKTTGFSEDDLQVLWDAIMNMFEFDRSSVRCGVSVRQLYIFKHDSVYGNAPAHKLIDLVKINRVNKEVPARCFKDYEITVDYDAIPEGVTLEVRD